jgi:hypothetical protein
VWVAGSDWEVVAQKELRMWVAQIGRRWLRTNDVCGSDWEVVAQN